MKIIKKLSEFIEEELEGAEEYALCSIKHKDDDMMLAKMFYDMSVEELRHSDMLHEQVVKKINEYKSKGEVVPESMQAVYDYLHEKNIDHANRVRNLQVQYKGQ